MSKKKILFLSGIDFKEKSIQVIRKTPEAFVKRGWEVHYIVLRDYSKGGNYFYEDPINPEGVKITRLAYKFPGTLNKIKGHLPRTIINKFISFIGVFQLVFAAKKAITNNNFDVVYGYEHIGTQATRILKRRGRINKKITISRFQGTWLSLYWKQKRYFKLLLNFDFIKAMRFASDICIMTDDGTQGDFIAKKLLPRKTDFNFWTNGVDYPVTDEKSCEAIIEDLQLSDKLTIISVSRLEGWKRVDRCIRIIETFTSLYPEAKETIKYLIVGEGNERKNLEAYVQSKGLEKTIEFIGAVPNTMVANYLKVTDIFFSFYDLSNVGNPLLEAIRANKIVFTLANGDTPKWINHDETGFIYDPSSNFIQNAAKDLYNLANETSKKERLKDNILELEKEKLWTWEERFDAEINLIESKLNDH